MFARNLLVIMTTCALLMACEQGANSPRGFSLPVGDVERGKSVFLSSGCLSCHAVDGLESDANLEVDPPVRLGGKVALSKTYADLVTSVINPSHKIAHGYREGLVDEEGQSKMRNYNDLLTVSQLIDLVTFLETHYELEVYRPTRYR